MYDMNLIASTIIATKLAKKKNISVERFYDYIKTEQLNEVKDILTDFDLVADKYVEYDWWLAKEPEYITSWT
jgi:hypothetical protein